MEHKGIKYIGGDEYHDIVIIKSNEFNLENENITFEEFSDEIEKYIEIKNVKIKDLMSTIVSIVGINKYPELAMENQLCHNTVDSMYQMMFLNKELYGPKYIDNTDKHNYICDNMIYERNVTSKNNVVILKSNILNDGTCEPSSITKQEMIEIIYKKYFHYAISIELNENGNETIKEYKFHKNPILTNNENIGAIQINYLKFGLIFLCEIDPVINHINKTATRIAGKYKFYGNVMIYMGMGDKYLDLRKDLFEKIDFTSYGSLDDRIVKDYSDEQKNENGFVIINNSYMLLDKMYNEKINKPIYPVLCNGCYRKRYQTQLEMNNDKDHEKECLVKIKSSNLIFKRLKK